ncbi:MAG: 3-phosphoshikimate 1-carboxyvinyltransferase, partial [Actinobacteria bacterium]|nr:3-phosphoshikimate 1-carboxyvinyltransferase [Actinomycetota bacterium]
MGRYRRRQGASGARVARRDAPGAGLVSAGGGHLTVRGGAPLTGTLRLPGCKGVSHRALFAAAVADGDSEVTNLGTGRDVASSRAVLGRLGVATADLGAGGVAIAGRGIDALTEPTEVLDCGNSGTTMRFLAGLCAGRPFLGVLVGDASLSQRPMARVLDPLRAMGASVDGRDGGRLAPLVIRGGALRGGRHELAAASGQVKTALVLAGLQADGVTEVVEPAPSRDHTERLLGALGAPVEVVDARTTRVRAGAVAPFTLDVPGDPSSAAFFVVAACVVPGSHVVLEGVLGNPGRIAYLEVLREMGADVTVHERGGRLGEPVVDIEVRAAPLRGTVIRSREGIVDELPVLAVAAAFADGPSEIVDAAELRVKESDRIATLVSELGKLGVGVEARPDGLAVAGGADAAAVPPGA